MLLFLFVVVMATWQHRVNLQLPSLVRFATVLSVTSVAYSNTDTYCLTVEPTNEVAYVENNRLTL